MARFCLKTRTETKDKPYPAKVTDAPMGRASDVVTWDADDAIDARTRVEVTETFHRRLDGHVTLGRTHHLAFKVFQGDTGNQSGLRALPACHRALGEKVKWLWAWYAERLN